MALNAMKGEKAPSLPLSAPTWGFSDVYLGGKPVELHDKLATTILDSVIFKLVPVQRNASTAIEAALAKLRPGLIYVQLSAFGDHGPWANRRGSLVQTATGFNSCCALGHADRITVSDFGSCLRANDGTWCDCRTGTSGASGRQLASGCVARSDWSLAKISRPAPERAAI